MCVVTLLCTHIHFFGFVVGDVSFQIYLVFVFDTWCHPSTMNRFMLCNFDILWICMKLWQNAVPFNNKKIFGYWINAQEDISVFDWDYWKIDRRIHKEKKKCFKSVKAKKMFQKCESTKWDTKKPDTTRGRLICARAHNNKIIYAAQFNILIYTFSPFSTMVTHFVLRPAKLCDTMWSVQMASYFFVIRSHIASSNPTNWVHFSFLE